MTFLRLPSPIPTHDIVTILIHAVVDSAAVMLNMFLLLAIILRSPPSLRSYAILLILGAIVDIIAAMTSSLIIIRLIPAHEVLAYAYDGICVAVSGFFCHCMYAIMLACFSQSIWLLVISFGYRLYVLGSGSQSRRQLLHVCLLSAAHNIIILTSYISIALDDPEEVRDGLRRLRPEYELDDYHIEGHVSILNALNIFTISAVTVFTLPLMLLVLLLRAMVLRALRAQMSIMSGKTMQMHNTLVKNLIAQLISHVLTIQSLLPIIFFAASCSFFSCVFDIYYSPVSEHFMMTSTTFSPLLAPAISLYYIQPYRANFSETAKSAKVSKHPIGNSVQPHHALIQSI